MVEFFCTIENFRALFPLRILCRDSERTRGHWRYANFSLGQKIKNEEILNQDYVDQNDILGYLRTMGYNYIVLILSCLEYNDGKWTFWKIFNFVILAIGTYYSSWKCFLTLSDWNFWIGTFYSLPIFGQNVTVVPIESRQQFKDSYAALPQLATETCRECSKDVPQMDRKLTEELPYYNTAMLWLRLIDIKSKTYKHLLVKTHATETERQARRGLLQPASIAAHILGIHRIHSG